MSEGKGKAAAVVMIAALAYGLGSCSAKQDSSGAHAPRVLPGPTKTVTERETVTREVMPQSCKDALRLAKEIDADAGPLIDVSDQALDIMEQAHESMTMSDGSKLNKLRSDLYQLSGKTSKPAVDLRINLMPEFDRQMKACLKTDAYKAR